MLVKHFALAWYIAATMLLVAEMCSGEVTLDGTLGPKSSLSGPNYQIPAEVGRRAGSNLFHSFGLFNVNTTETATFSGPQSVENILGRVTGGSVSTIDGLLRSTIPGADLYLINPAGLIFGENARLDVQGSFHAGTVDFVKLNDGTRFNALPSGDDALLTTAPPEAFGFLGENRNSKGILVQSGNFDLTTDITEGGLDVPSGRTLSLIGGDVSLSGGVLTAPGGRIQIASLASAAEIPVKLSDLNTKTVDALGDVRLKQGARVNVNGDGNGGGTVVIRGGRLMVSDTTVSADTRGTTDGAATGIDVQVAQDVDMTDRTEIRSDTFAEGNAGDIKIRTAEIKATAAQYDVVVGSRVQKDQDCGTACGNAGSVKITAGTVELMGGKGGDSGEEGDARIESNTNSSGNAGHIEIRAGTVKLTGGAVKDSGKAPIESSALENSTGNAGNVTVKATESVTISGEEDSGFFSNAKGAGKGGQIFVETPNLEMSNDGEIQASTSSSGNAGAIDVRVGRLKIESGGGIESKANTGSTGNAGRISVRATERVTITGGFERDGKGRLERDENGRIQLETTTIATTTRGKGDGGKIFLKAPVVELVNFGTISAGTFAGKKNGPLPKDDGKGNAGAIELKVNRLTLTGGSNIESRSGFQFEFTSMGNAGKVTIKAEELITIDGQGVDDKGNILRSRVTTLTEGVGRGGDIDIETRVLTLNDGGTISAESRPGDPELPGAPGRAGDIRIQVDDTFESIDGSVRAAADKSGGGTIEVSAGKLVHLVDSKFSTAVRGGAGMAGNISIDPEFVILDNSQIIANAIGGPGGNISIVADNFFETPNSVVNASSEKSIDGTVDIDSPDTNVTSGLETLPAAFFDATRLLSTPCQYRSGTDVGQLIVESYEVLPNSPYAFSVQLPELITGASELDLGEENSRKSPQSTGHVIDREKSNPYLSTDPSRNEIHVLLSRAAAFYANGQIKRAVSALNKAGLLVDPENDPNSMALISGGMSDGYLLTRRLDDAMRSAKESLSWARKAENPPVLAVALNYFGNLLAAQQRYGEARKAYEEALAITKRSPDLRLTSSLTLNRLRAETELDDTRLNANRVSTAMDKFQLLPASTQKGYGLIAIGHLAQRLMASKAASRDKLSELAHKAFTDTEGLADVLDNPRLRSFAIGHLGELYAIHGFDSESEQFFRRALFFAEEAGAIEVSAGWYWKLGELLYENGRQSEAKSAYTNAIDKFDAIERALLYGRRGQPRLFSETVGNVYRRLAEIGLQETDIETEPLRREAALRSVREVMERFKVAELRNHFQDECINTQLEPSRQTQIDALLQPNTATLYPIVFPDHLSLLVGFDDGALRSVNVPVNTVELKKDLIAFRKLLHHKGDLRRLRNIGFKLYHRLIEPIVPFLEEHEVESLIVVPDGALSTIPFAALYDGHDFLVNRYAFALSPGLTMTDMPRVESEAGLTLLAGLTESVQGYSSLPFVRTELGEVASLYEGKLLVDKSFKKSQVEAELNRTSYRVINFATHAEIASDPKQSFLLTYDDRISFDELEKFIRIGQFREQPLDLLVLSACSTAAGDERAALGLAGIAVKSGAQSVIGSLWNVSDASTAKLIPAVFRNLKTPSTTKVRALQSAQQQLLSDPRYKHPYYWAPFVLIGNWQ